MYPIPMTAHSAYIPTLEGDEAEEFIRKADENVKAMRERASELNSEKPSETVDTPKFKPTETPAERTLQSKRAERILEKSRIAMRKMLYTKSATPNVKRSKDVEP